MADQVENEEETEEEMWSLRKKGHYLNWLEHAEDGSEF